MTEARIAFNLTPIGMKASIKAPASKCDKENGTWISIHLFNICTIVRYL